MPCVEHINTLCENSDIGRMVAEFSVEKLWKLFIRLTGLFILESKNQFILLGRRSEMFLVLPENET